MKEFNLLAFFYEDLLNDPERIIETICSFSGRSRKNIDQNAYKSKVRHTPKTHASLEVSRVLHLFDQNLKKGFQLIHMMIKPFINSKLQSPTIAKTDTRDCLISFVERNFPSKELTKEELPEKWQSTLKQDWEKTLKLMEKLGSSAHEKPSS